MEENVLNAAVIEKWKSESNIENNLISLKSSIKDVFVSQFSEASVEYKCALLELIRYLCRDKNIITPLFSDNLVETLLQAGGIYPDHFIDSLEVVIEAGKCLNNALLNSVVVRTVFEKRCEQCLIGRIQAMIKHFEGSQESYIEQFSYLTDASNSMLETLLFFDLRMAFIASAHSIELQKKWVDDNDKTNAFLEVLKFSCQKLPIIDPRKSQWASDALRVLFNIYCHAQIFDVDFAQECANECARLIRSNVVEDDLKQDAVHFLTIVRCCLPPLCPELNEEEQKHTTKVYDGYDMRFVDSLLEVMSRKIDKTPQEEIDMLTSYFATLMDLCKNHKAARRYCRLKVIPPLKAEHVEKPPDEGKTLRNKIIKILTLNGPCKDAAAEFLFVLCKRSVPRLIKYTGFGHSAGLLANYGFLGAINEQKRESDSEDSETESYNEVRNKVHPVTGYIQPDKVNPLDNMSDEQKEYEAIKLANAMDKLMSEGIFQPSRIGPDGKPVPVGHVNELIKDFPNEEEKDSDSD
uniref:Synembryn-A n=1 Tax=Panagrolaimus sp. ES5 TaxID=591445 RepID=A0AC34GNH9_9BILA